MQKRRSRFQRHRHFMVYEHESLPCSPADRLGEIVRPSGVPGLGIRGTARVFEIDANTALQWLVEAAEQLHALSAYFLRELQIN